jgi:diguanylate cyclase (GGDEF)-like protein
MYFDLPTLMIAGSFVAAASGVFLAFAWLQNREATAPLWWAAANLALATGVPLLSSAGSAFGVPSMVLGILLLNLSPALIFAAAVSCNNRRPNPIVVAAGAAIWLLAFAAIFRLSADAQMALNLGVVAAYLFAAALEFWFGNAEKLQTRWPLIVLLTLHGGFFAIGAVKAAAGDLAPTEPPTLDSWFGLIHFETLAFVIGTAIFAVAMVKERREMVEKTAARIDPLTGVANRRAFMENAGALLARGLANDEALAMIVIDLDRFKSINDNFGHALGDRVLAEFGATARSTLRATDLVGRPGGEEFAVMLPGSSAGAAYVVAERMRFAFSEACLALGVAGFRATLSAGVAAAHPDSTLDSLFAAADRALYTAKTDGRDRVIVAERDRGSERAPRAAEPEKLAAEAA